MDISFLKQTISRIANTFSQPNRNTRIQLDLMLNYYVLQYRVDIVFIFIKVLIEGL